MSNEETSIRADAHLMMPDADWDLALIQVRVIGRLAERGHATDEPGPVSGVAAIDEAAAELGTSRRQVYLLWRGSVPGRAG